MTWNFDIDAAPRGEVVEVSRTSKHLSVYRYARVILACHDGVTVTVSRWLPDNKRWEGLATGEVPVAWMPWPSHPEAESKIIREVRK